MSDHEGKTTTGGCLCGAVRYKIAGQLRAISNCHCSQCRKTSGHFGAFSTAPEDALGFIDDGGLKWFQSSQQVRRGFCGQCGSSLFYDHQKVDYIAIAAGSLEGPTGLKTTRHIFTDDKGDYYDLNDDLPKFTAYPD